MTELTESEISELEKQTLGRYQFQKVLGKGAYGIVYEATDIQTGKRVAIKQVNNIFDTLLDAQRILSEISKFIY